MSASLSSFQSDAKFRVAICGAGIAGLILAITIGKYEPSIPIDLYEAHDSIETAGVGIGLRRHEVLIELGLFDAIKQIFTRSVDSTGLDFGLRRSDIPEGGYAWYKRENQNSSATMHRQQMVAILEKHLPPSCSVYFKKRLLTYTESKQQSALSKHSIELEFSDGTIATTDVLVGADGIRSAVRKALFEAASKDEGDTDNVDLRQYIAATFTGMTIYRSLIPAEKLMKENPTNLSLQGMTGFHGKGKLIATYPVAKGTLINVAANICDPSLRGTQYQGRWVSEVAQDELAEHFEGFEPDARAVIKLCEKPSKWALHVVKPLPFCVRGRVALIGDACHAMTPHFGAGAGQAIEDAFVLGRLIAHSHTKLYHIPDVLRIYEEVRLPIARDVADLSFSTGWLYTFMEPGYYDGTRVDDLDEKGISGYEREGMETIKEEIERRWDRIDGLSSGLQVWNEAESKLKVLVAN